MKIGICSPITDCEKIKAAGYEYVEPSVRAISALTDEEFDDRRRLLEATGLKVKCANCFFPTEGYALTGEKTVSFDGIYSYTDRVMKRLSAMGCTTAVLGDGRLRSFPEGFDKGDAEKQFAKVALCCADAARKHGVTICVEPLRRAETNLVHTLADAARIISLTGASYIRITADIFHMYDASESFDEIIRYGDLIGHVHLAYPPTRAMPAADDGFDYTSLGKALKQIGYSGCASFEWHKKDLVSDMERGAPVARLLRDMVL